MAGRSVTDGASKVWETEAMELFFICQSCVHKNYAELFLDPIPLTPLLLVAIFASGIMDLGQVCALTGRFREPSN